MVGVGKLTTNLFLRLALTRCGVGPITLLMHHCVLPEGNIIQGGRPFRVKIKEHLLTVPLIGNGLRAHADPSLVLIEVLFSNVSGRVPLSIILEGIIVKPHLALQASHHGGGHSVHGEDLEQNFPTFNHLMGVLALEPIGPALELESLPAISLHVILEEHEHCLTGIPDVKLEAIELTPPARCIRVHSFNFKSEKAILSLDRCLKQGIITTINQASKLEDILKRNLDTVLLIKQTHGLLKVKVVTQLEISDNRGWLD